MIRYYELIGILLVSLCYYTATAAIENQKNAEERITNHFKPEKSIFQKSQPYPEGKNDSLFMSQLATWLFPTGGYSENIIDPVPAASSFSGPQYLPPPSGSQYHSNDNCNPCNQEPWIPMASNIGQQTIISFVSPDFSSHISSLDYIHPPLPSYGTPSKQYGPSVGFRPSNNNELPNQFKFQTGPSLDEDEIVIVDYMIPPPLDYKIPSLRYGPPRNPSGSFKPLYGPPKPIYGPPKPIYEAPKPIYGPPKPVYGPAKSVYEPPKPIYGPPKPLYGPPLKQNKPDDFFHGQIPPNPYFGHRPSEQFGASPLFNSFKPPPLLTNQYGPPYGNSHSTHLQTVAESYTTAPSFPNLDYGAPTSSLDYNPVASIPVDENNNIPPAVPSDSYGVPVTGDSLKYLAPSEQLSSPSGNSEHLERPIPLPNLSFAPVPPIYSYGEFNKEFNNPQRSSQTSNEEHQEYDDVQIQKSVNVADYLATIEHPINVIQSPIVEVSIKDNTHETPSHDNSNIALSDNINSPNIYNQKEEKVYNNINEQLYEGHVNRNENPINLNTNPIIVDDVHAAASNINNSIVDLQQTKIKRTNDKRLLVQQFNAAQNVKGDSVNTNIIKDILLKQNSLGGGENEKAHLTKKESVHISNNNSDFTTPRLDYSNWQPSFTGNIASSSRVGTALPDSISTTTKKPKQIIIPYITNKMSDNNWSHNNQATKNPSNINTYNNNIYTTLLPIYTPPSSTEISIWSRFVEDFNSAESKRVTATAFTQATTAVYNIKDLLSQHLPYDIFSLQKNIDKWTHQAYSSKSPSGGIHKSTEKLLTSKKIPDEYFTTQPYTDISETATVKNYIFDNYADASLKNESFVKRENSDVETNLIQDETTTETATTLSTTLTFSTKVSFPSPFSPKGQRSLWDISHTTISPLTKEKVYVVTPQTYNFYTSTPPTAWSMAPKIEHGKVNNDSTYGSRKFSIRVEPENKNREDKVKKDLKNAVKIIYSEWPHLINNLQTTTSIPTLRHPLFGLMDISAYTPPPNSTVETILGHSRVVSGTTASPVPKKEITDTTDKRTIHTTSTSY